MSGSLKLINLIETHGEAIARQWAKDVRKHRRTPSYHDLPEDQVVQTAVRFYENFRRMFYAENPAEVSREYFARYAEESYRRNIPLQEAIYALILMRRHIWLYAEFQAVFITAVEQKHAVDSLVRTILMFDYAVYFVTERYQELLRKEVDKVMGPVMVLYPEAASGGILERFKSTIMGIILICVLALTFYFHSVLGMGIIFTHLYYIPIVLGAMWWRKRGIWIAVFLGIYLLFSHLIYLKDVPVIDDVIRAALFVIVAGIVGYLSEGLARVREVFGSVAPGEEKGRG